MSKNPYSGKNETPAGVMPEEMAKRHKLFDVNGDLLNSPGERGDRKSHRGDHNFKYLVELVKAYRLDVHGVMAPRLASPLKMAMHSFFVPMARGDGDSPMNTDRRLHQSAEAEEGDDPTKVPLKI